MEKKINLIIRWKLLEIIGKLFRIFYLIFIENILNN